MTVHMEFRMPLDPIAPAIIGTSAPIQRLRDLIDAVARTGLPVLVQGPTGAGKELVAAALHKVSGRRGAFVPFNVCAISDSMFEDALFGHVRGAFTGALHDAAGFLREAHGGTIFLDEISGLPPVQQAKLLRAVETGVFRPVGASRDVHSEFRVVSATNERIDALVQRGQFRTDLAHRLGGVTISVPALMDRTDDIPLLVRHFLERLGLPDHVGEEPMELLTLHSWPGNVRELKQVVEYAVALGNGRMTAHDVRAALAHRRSFASPSLDRDAVARRNLRELLERCDWNMEVAARQLGVHRATLYRRVKRLQLFATVIGQRLRSSEQLTVDSR
jgi:DNA-binding NtrC family response regulator